MTRRTVLVALALALSITGAGLLRWSLAEAGPPAPGVVGVEALPDGAIRSFSLVAEPASRTRPDGLELDVWAYNGTVPGPELRVDLGDTVVVELANRLPEPTTIHWHGVRVPNDMDGVPWLNQDPVEPGESFTYEFRPPDAGTFWFHSHTRGAEQLERGLYGSLVVEDPREVGPDVDLTWMVDDWLVTDAGALDVNFSAFHDVTHNGRWGNVVTTNGVVAPQAPIAPGSHVRLRIVNASNARVIAPIFDGLVPRVTSVDGLAVDDPFDGNEFVLAPGNRIDVEFVMPDSVVAVDDDFNGEGYRLGTLVPHGARRSTDVSAAPPRPFVAMSDGSVAPDPDHVYTLDFLEVDGSPAWGMNERTLPDADTWMLELGAISTARLVNRSQAIHPIHVHGQFFRVVAVDGIVVDEGFTRDTVLVWPGQSIDIAIDATAPGTWLVHCHIQEHADAGMATLLDVG